MSKIIRHSTFIVAVMLLAGCASTGTGGGNSTGGGNMLTSEQLIATNETNTYNAVQRLCPAWLRPRGQTSVSATNGVTLFVDGSPRGDVSNLRTMNVTEIRDVEYLSASDAAFRFGTIAGSNGTVAVRTQN